MHLNVFVYACAHDFIIVFVWKDHTTNQTEKLIQIKTENVKKKKITFNGNTFKINSCHRMTIAIVFL